MKQPSQIEKQIEYYEKHAKKQEDNGQFDTVFHDRLKQLKAMIKPKKVNKKQTEIQKPSEYGEK